MPDLFRSFIRDLVVGGLDKAMPEVLGNLLNGIVPHLPYNHGLPAVGIRPGRADIFLQRRLVKGSQAQFLDLIDDFILLGFNFVLLVLAGLVSVLTDAKGFIHQVIVDVSDQILKHILALRDMEFHCPIILDNGIHNPDNAACALWLPPGRGHFKPVEFRVMELIVFPDIPYLPDFPDPPAKIGQQRIITVTLDAHFNLLLPFGYRFATITLVGQLGIS